MELGLEDSNFGISGCGGNKAQYDKNCRVFYLELKPSMKNKRVDKRTGYASSIGLFLISESSDDD